MSVIHAAAISMWVFALAVAAKHNDPVIPILFFIMLVGLIGIAIVDLGWLDRFLRWLK